MNHIIFKENPSNNYKIAILIKSTSFSKKELYSSYVKPLINSGIQEDSVIGFDLSYTDKGNAPAKFQKEYLANLLPALTFLGVTTLLVADSAYFKTLTKVRKVEPHHGYILPCAIKGFESINCILSVNYQGLFYNPKLQDRIDLSLSTLTAHIQDTHIDIGSNIIHYAYYPNSNNDFSNIGLSSIQQVLNNLLDYEILTCDIETFSLRFNKAGIGTISFAWDQHNGIAFPVDYVPNKDPSVHGGLFGYQEDNQHVKAIVRLFFENFKGKLIWHNSNFDIKILIYELWMDDLLDIKGLIKGLEIMTRLIDDTKIIAYLATNSTAGNNLKLKYLAHEFAGNYAQDDINDIRLIPLPDLLKYNLIDCLATWYVWNKYYPIMLLDDQQNVYDTIMIPSVKVLLQMELHGMPINMDKVKEVKEEFTKIASRTKSKIFNSSIIQEYTLQLQKCEMMKANLLLKKKVKPLEDFAGIRFNPGSNLNLQGLLYEELGFEIQDKTKTGQPATGSKVIKKLMFQLMNKHNITEEDLK